MKEDLPQENDSLQPLMISEVLYYLNGERERIGHSKNQSHAEAFKKTVDYIEQFGKLKGKTLISDLKKTLKSYNLTDVEIAKIGSLLPQTVEELRVLIPSVNRLDEDILVRIVARLQHWA
ncbi:DNA-directed RNA polymerase II subunit D [Spraguea lophii 42_110]|uniref:DNA-directed RNA polymerase II subunit D n=1 Tax=Spraguea lophii (strain 42_110) TaxID=1358809 RepID=S7W7N5_SPRLO|nr:DNA-directed RNA polymerase II subunit D [Spraguea lophii 42_110]